jgi:hypothetical protein
MKDAMERYAGGLPEGISGIAWSAYATCDAIIIHLLGQATEGCLAALDTRRDAGWAAPLLQHQAHSGPLPLLN